LLASAAFLQALISVDFLAPFKKLEALVLKDCLYLQRLDGLAALPGPAGLREARLYAPALI